jgi:hypothetical protein
MKGTPQHSEKGKKTLPLHGGKKPKKEQQTAPTHNQTPTAAAPLKKPAKLVSKQTFQPGSKAEVVKSKITYVVRGCVLTKLQGKTLLLFYQHLRRTSEDSVQQSRP